MSWSTAQTKELQQLRYTQKKKLVSMDKRSLPSLLLARRVCCTSVLLLWCGCCVCSLASCLYSSSSSPSLQVEASCCQCEGENRTDRACASRRVVSGKLLMLTVTQQEHRNLTCTSHHFLQNHRETHGRYLFLLSKGFCSTSQIIQLLLCGPVAEKMTCGRLVQQYSNNTLLYTTHFQMRQSLNLLEIRRPLSL